MRSLLYCWVAALFCALSLSTQAIAQTTIASGLDVPYNLRLRDGTVYFVNVVPSTNFGALETVPITGGTASVLSSGGVLSFSLDATNIYLSRGDYTGGGVSVTPISGGTEKSIASFVGGSLIGPLGSDVYFSSNFQEIDRVPAIGGATAPVAGGVWVRGSAIDSTGIYFDDYWSNSIKKYDFFTGSLTTLAYAQPEGNDDVRVDSSNVYYNLHGQGIYAVPKSGGTSTPLALGSGVGVSAVAPNGAGAYTVSNGFVYYADGGSIKRVPTSGGSAINIAAISPGSVTSMVSDGTYLYWGASGGRHHEGTINRIPLLSTAVIPPTGSPLPRLDIPKLTPPSPSATGLVLITHGWR